MEVPSKEAHKNHPMGVTASVGNFVNPKVVDKIYEIVKTGNNSCFLMIILIIILIFNSNINFVCMFTIDTDGTKISAFFQNGDVSVTAIALCKIVHIVDMLQAN